MKIPETRESLDRRLEVAIRRLLPLNPERIILFGSASRGDMHQFSDIDLCVIHESSESIPERIQRALSLLGDVTDVEPVCYTKAEFERMAARGNPFIERILREARMVYER